MLYKKRLGQNFISDTNFLASLVRLADIGSCDNVLEVGAGAGSLTRELCRAAASVVSYEIDGDLRPVLAQNLAGIQNLSLILGDIMDATSADINALFGGKPFKLAANLPYYITTPVIFKFIEQDFNVSHLFIMVQKEVADRILAAPDTADYGALSAAVQTRCDVRLLKDVPRRMFYPVPNVDSAFVALAVNPQKFDVKDRALLARLIRAAFAMRRKTLANNLVAAFSLSRAQCESLLLANNIAATARGETLSPAQFVALANALC